MAFRLELTSQIVSAEKLLIIHFISLKLFESPTIHYFVCYIDDEIRQTEGFKNVSLGNVIPASYKDANIPFVSEKDKDYLNKHRIAAFEVFMCLNWTWIYEVCSLKLNILDNIHNI